MNRVVVITICVLVSGTEPAQPGLAPGARSEAERLRLELKQLRAEYERRIRVLEDRLEALERTAQFSAQTNEVAGDRIEAAMIASTNAAGSRTDSFRDRYQRETESRERALSLLKNRLIKERVEHVLQGFVDISGYFRAGYGRNDEGTSQVPFQAPGTLAKYRLGNETENYGELILAKDWYVPDLFKVDSTSHSAGATSGPIAHVQLRAAFLDPYSNYGSPDTFQTTLPEVWASVGNAVPSQPALKFWAGNRYYRRHDIHINDFYFLNMSGGGGGFKDLELPFGKLALSFHRSLRRPAQRTFLHRSRGGLSIHRLSRGARTPSLALRRRAADRPFQ